MRKTGFVLLALALAGMLQACAMGGRREAIKQEFQFDKVDTNHDGSISRTEFDQWKTSLQGMRHGG